MKKYLTICVVVVLFFCLGCSSNFFIIEPNSMQKKQITVEKLNLFKEKQYISVSKIKNRSIREEIKNIKGIINRENLMPSTIFNYAFVLKKDTVYASSNLKYWYYKGKVQIYTSKVINTETIENLLNK